MRASTPHRLGGAIAIALLALACLPQARAELTQKGNLRVSFQGAFSPTALPRHGTAPIGLAMKGAIGTTDGSAPPQLQRFEIAINRGGRLDHRGLPTCTIAQIQPTTTANALRACSDAKVGEGSFSADVSVPEQSPFPSKGKLIAFNGKDHGHPAILAHVFGSEPVPTSFTLALRISQRRGTFGTVLSGALPHVTSKVAVVTGIELNLKRSFTYRGARHSYLSAACPAPKGFPGALFPFARARFDFEDGRRVSTTLTRSCKVR
jgi:hypothetical protein